MRDAFGVERGDEISKLAIPGAVTNFASKTMARPGVKSLVAKPGVQNTIKGMKSGFGGWKQPGLGASGAIGAGAGKAGAFGLKNKTAIGAGAGGAALGVGGYKLGQNS